IELMITNHPRVVSEVIEKIDHQFALVSKAHLCALIDIADIDQDRVRILPPPSADLRDATRQTAAISSSVVIRCRQNMAMQICRVQDRDADRVRLKRGSSTGQRRTSTKQSRTAGEFQEIAPRPGSVWVRHCGWPLPRGERKMSLGFIGKGAVRQRKERLLGQPPKSKIDGWEAVVP